MIFRNYFSYSLKNLSSWQSETKSQNEINKHGCARVLGISEYRISTTALRKNYSVQPSNCTFGKKTLTRFSGEMHITLSLYTYIGTQQNQIYQVLWFQTVIFIAETSEKEKIKILLLSFGALILCIVRKRLIDFI